MNAGGEVSGRNTHRAKITIYLTEAELLSLDHTLLELRRVYGVKVDRGRYVREALAAARLGHMADRIRKGPR